MSTVPPETASTTDELLVNLLFDYPSADRPSFSRFPSFPSAKNPVINSSPVLGGLIQRNSDSFDSMNAESSLPVVPLPESGEILHCLLTFIFLVAPRIPPTHEETMELLSAAQKYQMGTVLIHIRGSIAQQYPPPTDLEPALRVYSLAQKYGLRPEAL
jgi:hypothetical protein